MTQQHFKALAAALLATKPSDINDTPDTFYAWTSSVSAVADVCGRFNPRFDRQRFLRAAGA